MDNILKIWIQDLGYRGCLMVIASNEKEAREKLASYFSEYNTKDLIISREITKDFYYESYGDR